MGERAADSAAKTLKCWQSHQSGFMIETSAATLIFDWYKGALPPIHKDKPLHIFISHIHGDHFNGNILSLANDYKDVSVYLGYDYSIDQFNDYLENLPEKIADTISCFDGERKLNTEFGTVESLTSTDLGVAFLVKMNDMTLYHAGDLFPWGGNRQVFESFTAPLRGVHIDYAMLPLDPRFPDEAEYCISHYLKLAGITYFTPMHLWDNPDFVSAFAWRNAQYCPQMIAINPRDADIRQSIDLLKPYTIQL